MATEQTRELIWFGKGNRPRIEPRILMSMTKKHRHAPCANADSETLASGQNSAHRFAGVSKTIIMRVQSRG